MAIPSEQTRTSMLPSFLYSSSSSSSVVSDIVLNRRNVVTENANVVSPSASRKTFVVPAPSEPGKIAMYSPAFYAACTVGGILSCGLTHTAVTPLDLVKCNMQVDA